MPARPAEGLGQHGGQIFGMLGDRAGQHRPDVIDVGAPGTQYQPQVGFFEARFRHRTGVDQLLPPRHQRGQDPAVGVIGVLRIGHG